VIIFRQLRADQPSRRQAQRALAEHPEYDWEPPRCARRFDAVVRGGLGKMKHLAAVAEEGREARGQVQAARIQLGQVSDEGGGCLSLAPGEDFHLGYQIAVGQVGWDIDLHGYSVSHWYEWGGPFPDGPSCCSQCSTKNVMTLSRRHRCALRSWTHITEGSVSKKPRARSGRWTRWIADRVVARSSREELGSRRSEPGWLRARRASADSARRGPSPTARRVAAGRARASSCPRCEGAETDAGRRCPG
jgi:hypothetical protein